MSRSFVEWVIGFAVAVVAVAITVSIALYRNKLKAKKREEHITQQNTDLGDTVNEKGAEVPEEDSEEIGK